MINIGLRLAVLLEKRKNRRHDLDRRKTSDANRPSIYLIILRGVIFSARLRLDLAILREDGQRRLLPRRISIDKNKRRIRLLPGIHEPLEQQIMLQRIDP